MLACSNASFAPFCLNVKSWDSFSCSYTPSYQGLWHLLQTVTSVTRLLMPVDDTYQLTQPTTTITVNEQRYLMTVHTKYSRQPKIKNQNWLANRGQSTKNNIGQTGSVGIILCLTYLLSSGHCQFFLPSSLQIELTNRRTRRLWGA